MIHRSSARLYVLVLAQHPLVVFELSPFNSVAAQQTKRNDLALPQSDVGKTHFVTATL